MSGERHAVLIASSTYDDDKLPNLRCPGQDVDGLDQVLRAPEHGGFTSRKILKDRPHHEVLLGLNLALKTASKDDFVLIYFSGHGKQDAASRLYLCTPNTVVEALEATSVPVQSIREYVDVSPCRRIAIILDCCFSGAAGKAFAKGSVGDQLQLVSGGRGTYVMAASTGIQSAMEKEQDRYSLFTKHIIGGIESGEADQNSDGLVTMDELYKYVHRRVVDEGSQEPEQWGIQLRGELYLARSGKTPRAKRRERLRPILLDHAAKGVLPDEILAQAMGSLGMPADQLSPWQREADALLDRLADGAVSVGEFVGAWYRIQKEPEPPPRVPKARKRAPARPDPPPPPAPVPTQAPAPPATPGWKTILRIVGYAFLAWVAWAFLIALESC